ncbi:hypothetical protein [Paraburkholderia tropica]|uniref:hypothetical protein n=1 Tax=Paraburkholderia tropica TaxID=92647 RepID=UPI002AB72A3B|nr:hypothetical protein [Paraburkholderia tropica]
MKTAIGLNRTRVSELFAARRVMRADRNNRHAPLSLRIAAAHAQFELDARVRCELAGGARHRRN